MMQKIFTVFDSKAELYMQPFFMATTGQALRSFEDTCNDTSTVFSKHPADFTLFEIGTYDDLTGNIFMHDSKINLGNALEYVQKQIDALPKTPLEAVNNA